MDLAKREKTAFRSSGNRETNRSQSADISATIDEFDRYHPHMLQMAGTKKSQLTHTHN